MSKMEDFLNDLEKGTRKTYESHLNTFFKFIKADPETYISLDKEEDDYIKDIIMFLKERKKTRAPKTNIVSKSAILSFLEEYDIEIGRKGRKKINKQTKSKRAITRDLPFSKEDIKLFLPHVKPHIRAVILISISSGMRIDEVLKLKNNLIFLDKNPVTVYLTKDMTKNHEARTVFISDEAKEALESYLKTKPQHIKYMKKSNLVKATLKEPYDNELIFQFSYENVRKSLYRALDKVGLDTPDPTTNRHQRHIHSFKKYFKKQLTSTMDSNCLNQLTAHESELDRAYTPWEEPELAEEYLKNMKHISIYHTSIDLTETEERIKKLENKIEELHKERYERIHPYPDSKPDYFDIHSYELTKNNVIFYDINKKGKKYKITDEHRIDHLKEHYQEQIKYFRKQKNKEIKLE